MDDSDLQSLRRPSQPVMVTQISDAAPEGHPEALNDTAEAAKFGWSTTRTHSPNRSLLGMRPSSPSSTGAAASLGLPPPPPFPLPPTILGTLLLEHHSPRLSSSDRASSPPTASSTSSSLRSGTSPRKRLPESPLMRPSHIHLYSGSEDGADEEDEQLHASEEEERKQDDDAVFPTTTEFINRECRRRGWGTGSSRPTSNPFVMYALCSERANPWKDRRLHLLQPAQLSTSLENVYANSSSLCHALKFTPRPNDIIVSGVYRSGQTPLLQILASLRSGSIVAKEKLLEHADWLEAAHSPRDPAFHRNHPGGRLLKTHLPLRSVFGGIVAAPPKGMKPEFHVIVILRDPADVRLSWFRHVRRVYGKCNKVPDDVGRNFDAHVHVDDFSTVHLYAASPNITSTSINSWDYEHFVMEAIQPTFVEGGNRHLLIVYYEELLMNPRAFVQRVAEFVELGVNNPSLLDAIAQALSNDEDFPAPFVRSRPLAHSIDIAIEPSGPPSDHRRGSSGQGRQMFSVESLQRFDFKWRDIITAHTSGNLLAQQADHGGKLPVHLAEDTRKPAPHHAEQDGKVWTRHAGHGDGFSDYEKLMEATSPVLRMLLDHLAASAANSTTRRSRASTAAQIGALISPRSLARIGALFRSSTASKSRSGSVDIPSPTGSSFADYSDLSEDSQRIEGDPSTIPRPSTRQQQQLMGMLFPSHFPVVATSTNGDQTKNSESENNAPVRMRARTSSVLSFGQAFRESLTSGHHRHLAHGQPKHPPGAPQPELLSPFNVVYSYHHHQEVDPDDTSDDDSELNMFLDLTQSRFYSTRRHTTTNATSHSKKSSKA